MIYCPHCKRPSARETGACPHCGQDLVPGQPPAAAEAPAAAGEDAPVFGGASFDLEDEVGTLELEHDSIPPPPRVASTTVPASRLAAGAALAAPRVVDHATDDREEVLRVAGFGSPGYGLLGTLAYGLKVRSRLGALRVERAAAAREAHAAAATRAERLAGLARRAEGLGLTDDPRLERALDAARRHQGGSEDLARRRAGLAEDHREAKGRLLGRRAEIEQAAEPIREEERAAAAALARLENDQRRGEARVRRLRIELRNIQEIIARRQQEYAAPQRTADEKRRLLAEISEQDRKQPGLVAELNEQEAAVAELAAPVEEAAARLAEIRERLGAALAGIAGIDRELRELDRRFEEDRARLESEVAGGQALARDAWAEVGAALLDGDLPAALDDVRTPALEAATRERAAGRRLAVLELALSAYDAGVVARARLYGLLAAAAVLGLIALAAWLLA
jgi:hypothetical protein